MNVANTSFAQREAELRQSGVTFRRAVVASIRKVDLGTKVRNLSNYVSSQADIKANLTGFDDSEPEGKGQGRRAQINRQMDFAFRQEERVEQGGRGCLLEGGQGERSQPRCEHRL